MRLTAALLIAFSLSLPASVSADDLGRLFFTPEQRSALDARRKARIPDKPAAVVVESPVTRVDGFVSRGKGKSTVWVNGEAIPEGSQPEGLRITTRPSDPSSVTVNVGENENQVTLKIGQSFDRETGEVKNFLNGGEAGVSNPASRK